METSLPVAERPRRPEWMKVRAPVEGRPATSTSRSSCTALSLHTVCEEARCPNVGECWGEGTATFQILGDTCTRACRYCDVNSGKPESPPDPLEPLRRAGGPQMQLQYVVVTSVDRDDAPDRRRPLRVNDRALKAELPNATVEALPADFLGVEEDALRTVLGARPEVFAFNIESVRRLHRQVRARGELRRLAPRCSRARRRSPTQRPHEELDHRRAREDRRRGRRDDARPARDGVDVVRSASTWPTRSTRRSTAG